MRYLRCILADLYINIELSGGRQSSEYIMNQKRDVTEQHDGISRKGGWLLPRCLRQHVEQGVQGAAHWHGPAALGRRPWGQPESGGLTLVHHYIRPSATLLRRLEQQFDRARQRGLLLLHTARVQGMCRLREAQPAAILRARSARWRGD